MSSTCVVVTDSHSTFSLIADALKGWEVRELGEEQPMHPAGQIAQIVIVAPFTHSRDRFELVARVRENVSGQGTAILVLVDSDNDHQRARDAGADDSVQFPFTRAMLLWKIASLMENRRHPTSRE